MLCEVLIYPHSTHICRYIQEEIYESKEPERFICKRRIYEAVNKDESIRDKHLLELEVSAFSDGIAMQFIRYYHNDYNVTLEQIIECGKLWCRTMIERRSEKTIMLKE